MASLSYKINVISTTTGKQITLEVSPTNTMKELLEAVMGTLNYKGDFRLVLGFKEFGPQDYPKRLAELGIKDGDTLQLVPRPPAGRHFIFASFHRDCQRADAICSP